MPILHWLNDEEARKTSSQLPYRLLEVDKKLSQGDSDSENMLIQGDNLEALKALLPYYAGQLKCISCIRWVRLDNKRFLY
jgi:adenine-specific DNA-methyltransferase